MTDISKASAMLNSLNRERQILLNEKSELANLATRVRAASDAYKAEVDASNPYERLIKDAVVAFKSQQAQLDAAQQELAEAKNKHEYASAVVEVFAPSGVRARRLDEATPLLNQRTAHYLGSLADGAIEAFWTTLTVNKNGDLREQFSVQVEKAGSAPSFNSLSGGEKRKVRLACALALQDLVATRASKSIDLWVGDEIDDALDTAGLERLMGVLEQKARERGTVLVVSHNDITHFASRTMNVVKKNGKAKVDFQ
jgi:DNA repair exonuclease SbcCD ATPase subunit